MSVKKETLAAAVSAALFWSAGAGAQDVDTSGWSCEYCPFQTGHEADYAVGATAANEDSAYFGDATGYTEKGGYANLDGNGSYAGEKYRMRWVAEDLGLDSRYAAMEGGRPGTYGFDIAWRELPRRQWITTDSIFAQSGSDTLTLPANWVRAGTTAGLTQLDSSLVRRDIESDRRILDIGGNVVAFGGLTVSADFRRQTNDGLNVYGGSSYTNASLLPMPFDYTTDEVEVGLRYALGAGYLSLGWYLSDFDNQNSALNWENPFTTAIGAEMPALAQAPDNRFQQLKLGGGYRFASLRTSVSASVSAIGQ